MKNAQPDRPSLWAVVEVFVTIGALAALFGIGAWAIAAAVVAITGGQP